MSSGLNLFLWICLLHFQVFFWIHDTAPRLIIIARSFQRLCELPERSVQQLITTVNDLYHDIHGAYVHAKSLRSCLTLCDSMDCSSPGSYIHGILQARILEWVAMPSSPGDLLTPGLGLHVSYISCTGRWVLIHGSPAYLIKLLVI